MTPRQRQKARHERFELIKERIRNTPETEEDEDFDFYCINCKAELFKREHHFCGPCEDRILNESKLEALEAEIARRENDYADDDNLPALAEERDILKARLKYKLGETHGRTQTA